MPHGHLPRVSLVAEPTPLEHLSRIGAALGHGSVYVKRDDVMALGLGGNKLRSLEFWIGEALRQECDTLLVAGMTASNQCRLTAAAAAKLGLHCIVMHNEHRPERIGGNLLLSQLYGAEMVFLGPMDEEARRDAVEAHAVGLRRSGRKVYIVGDSVLGAVGYVVAAEELLRQAKSLGVSFAHLVIPGSMGPTEAGFLYGLLRGGFRGRVHVISVEYQASEMTSRIETVFRGLEDCLGALEAGPGDIARYDDGFLGPGYAKASPEALRAAARFAATEALLLETTYTAKPFAALLSLIENGAITPDEPVCALHTGGVPTIFTA
jgi:1-aminocyclopropane-1-carboxylate deaminase/D-cysteine desulfhydrase-like pyridoxal-dependent ACC family enzyme